MKLSRRIALRPSRRQRELFAQHAGAARWTWNWGLAKRKESYAAWVAAGKPKGWEWPNYFTLHPELVKLKRLPTEEGGVPWLGEVSSRVPLESLRDLDVAFRRFFAGLKSGNRVGYPRFKSRDRSTPTFRLTHPGTVEADRIKLPTIGWVRISPGDRGYVPVGRYNSVSLVHAHGRWFASVLIDFPDVVAPPQTGPAEVGVDLGVRKLAVLSDGTIYDNPRAMDGARVKLRRAQRAVARSQRASNRRKRKVRRVGRIHRRVANLRRDALHKATTDIAKRYKAVAIEDLNVKGMTRSARGTVERPGRNVRQKAGLNRSISDASFGEFRRQLDYKLRMRGGLLIAVNPAYTSQRCSSCGSTHDPGSAETYDCATCGLRLDRDLNAARNIVAASWPETLNARGAGVRPGRACAAGQSVLKRERKRSNSSG